MGADPVDFGSSRYRTYATHEVFEDATRAIVRAATGKLLSKFNKNKSKLDEFLNEVDTVLRPFNQPTPAIGSGIARIDGMPPQGLAHALIMATLSRSDDLLSLIKKHGEDNKGRKSRVKVYLAALALTKLGDNLASVILISGYISIIEQNVSNPTQSDNAKNPRSPFRAIVLRVLTKNRFDTAEEIWEKLQWLTPDEQEIEFNDDPVYVEMDFFIVGNTKSEKRAKSYVEWNIGTDEPTKFRRSSLDKMISELRTEHGLPKGI